MDLHSLLYEQIDDIGLFLEKNQKQINKLAGRYKELKLRQDLEYDENPKLVTDYSDELNKLSIRLKKYKNYKKELKKLRHLLKKIERKRVNRDIIDSTINLLKKFYASDDINFPEDLIEALRNMSSK